MKFLFGGLLFLSAAFGLFAQTQPDALAEYRNGNYERSVTICRSELNQEPNNLESHVVICWSLIRLGRFSEASRYAQAGRILSRYDPRIIEIQGEISYYEGRNIEALQFFQEYINLAPNGQRIDVVYYFLGEIYIRLGRFRHADIALSTAVQWVPGNSAWWTRLAYARENAALENAERGARLRDFEDSALAYERALSLDPQSTDARRGLDRVKLAMSSIQ